MTTGGGRESDFFKSFEKKLNSGTHKLDVQKLIKMNDQLKYIKSDDDWGVYVSYWEKEAGIPFRKDIHQEGKKFDYPSPETQKEAVEAVLVKYNRMLKGMKGGGDNCQMCRILNLV